jgi:hypothetical protein
MIQSITFFRTGYGDISDPFFDMVFYDFHFLSI